MCIYFVCVYIHVMLLREMQYLAWELLLIFKDIYLKNSLKKKVK